MRITAKAKMLVLLGTALVCGGTYVAAASATGRYFDRGGNGKSAGTTGAVAIAVTDATDNSSTNLKFTGLLPGEMQTVTLNYQNSGTTNEDVYVVFPNETALGALNTLGNYGEVELTSSGSGAIGNVFHSTYLSGSRATCGRFLPNGCWPLLSQYELARNIEPGAGGSFSFSFAYASAFDAQAPFGTTAYWNSYPVSGQTTGLTSNESGSGLPYKIVATQPGLTPGQEGRVK